MAESNATKKDWLAEPHWYADYLIYSQFLRRFFADCDVDCSQIAARLANVERLQNRKRVIK